jgi:hypothetical protein
MHYFHFRTNIFSGKQHALFPSAKNRRTGTDNKDCTIAAMETRKSAKAWTLTAKGGVIFLLRMAGSTCLNYER